MPRIKGEGACIYHCVSRVVGRQFLLGEVEKEFLVALLRRLEAFHGCRILTYCVMSNHFHLLVEMPDPAEADTLGAGEILRRFAVLHGATQAEALREELDRAAAAGDGVRERETLVRLRRQMGELSVFMKQLKQRFSTWFNRREGRKGTLWEERFRSVLVEGDERAVSAVAAYIDLNPVRAGMVIRPEDYRWCGYGAAVAGEPRAREGIGRVHDRSPLVCGEGHEADWETSGSLYRLLLYCEGEAVEPPEGRGQGRRRGFAREEVEAEIARGGRLPLAAVLRTRVRYFSDGLVLGGAAFVEEVFERHRSSFGLRRKKGARAMRGADWGSLRVMRELRREVFG